MGYLLLEYVLLVDEIDVVEHGLVVDRGQSRDDLHEEVEMGVGLLVVVVQYLEDVPVQVECVFEVSYLVLQLVVLLSQKMLLHY